MTSSTKSVGQAKPGKERKKSFRELFTLEEIAHYGIAAIIYIALGVWLQDLVLNWVFGPIYIIVWMWIMPPLVNRVRSR